MLALFGGLNMLWNYAWNASLGTLAFLFALELSTPAHAYLDPGTGSMILQLVLGGVAGALVIGKLYWEKLKAILGISSPVSSTNPSQNSDRK
jgi:hypothetical protein